MVISNFWEFTSEACSSPPLTFKILSQLFIIRKLELLSWELIILLILLVLINRRSKGKKKTINTELGVVGLRKLLDDLPIRSHLLNPTRLSPQLLNYSILNLSKIIPDYKVSPLRNPFSGLRLIFIRNARTRARFGSQFRQSALLNKLRGRGKKKRKFSHYAIRQPSSALAKQEQWPPLLRVTKQIIVCSYYLFFFNYFAKCRISNFIAGFFFVSESIILKSITTITLQ